MGSEKSTDLIQDSNTIPSNIHKLKSAKGLGDRMLEVTQENLPQWVEEILHSKNSRSPGLTHNDLRFFVSQKIDTISGGNEKDPYRAKMLT